MRIAFLFPGQGSQYVGMGAKFYEASESARQVYRKAGEALGFDLAALCREGPENRLNQTEYTQPALLASSIAAWTVLKEKGIKATMLAGHSLGEYTALVAAGGLDFSDAVSLVHNRGRYMQEAVPEGVGAMAAILGLARADVEEVCRAASSEGIVSAANINSPMQIVIGGEKKAVESAMALAKKKGAKRTIPLAVSVPSHCALMKPAAIRLAHDLGEIHFKPLEIPVIANVDALPIDSVDAAKRSLITQLESPVLWVDTIQRMLQDGISVFIEIGPGSVLSGLVKRINREAKILHVEDPEGLESVVQELAAS